MSKVTDFIASTKYLYTGVKTVLIAILIIAFPNLGWNRFKGN